jgi:repressor LexA
MARYRVPYLTARQEAILHVIRDTIADRGEAPTVGEIAGQVGLRSWSSVHYQLRELEAKGAIAREPHRPRGIRLT